jgi:hypothetical protein
MRITITLDELQSSEFRTSRVVPLLAGVPDSVVAKSFLLAGMRQLVSDGVVRSDQAVLPLRSQSAGSLHFSPSPSDVPKPPRSPRRRGGSKRHSRKAVRS